MKVADIIPSTALENRISYYHILLLLVTLPFDQFFSHLVFISFSLHILFHLKKDKLKKVFTYRNLMLQSVFFITAISVIHTSHLETAGIDILRQLLVLLFPIFFSLSNLDLWQYRDRLLLAFTITCTGVIIYLYLHALYYIHYFHLPLKMLFSDVSVNQKFSTPINMHATFFSLHVAICFFYAVARLFTAQNKRGRILYLLSSAILFAGLVQLGSKAVVCVTVFGIITVVPYYLVSKTKRVRYLAFSGTVLVLLTISIICVKTYRERYITDLRTDLSKAPVVYQDVEPRIVRWQAALQVIKQKPIIGYGAGAELKILSDKYFEQRLYISYLNNLNAHNQYLTFLLVSGIVGLMVYMVTLYWGFKQAWQHGDMLFLIFMLLITVVSTSESLLNAEKGVFFYGLFFSLFVFSQKERSSVI